MNFVVSAVLFVKNRFVVHALIYLIVEQLIILVVRNVKFMESCEVNQVGLFVCNILKNLNLRIVFICKIFRNQ